MLEPAEQRHAHLGLSLRSTRGAHDDAVDSGAAVREEAAEARGHDGETVGVAQVVGPTLDLADASVAEVVAGKREPDEGQRRGEPRPVRMLHGAPHVVEAGHVRQRHSHADIQHGGKRGQ